MACLTSGQALAICASSKLVESTPLHLVPAVHHCLVIFGSGLVHIGALILNVGM